MKTLKYILFGVTIFGTNSCDDFLVETPQTNIAKDGVYNSVTSAKSALAGCYAKWADYNNFGFNYFHVLNVTSGMGVSIKQNDVNLTSMNILPSDVNMTNMYNGTYEVIRVANDIIDGMQNSTIADEKEKNRIWGEAYFSRAVCYFNLVRLFGKVSLVVQPVKSYQEAQKPRAAIADVYGQIVSDLEKAWTMMAEPGKGEAGHPHRYAAKALLAKVYLTMASGLEDPSYFQKAYDAGKEVYDAKAYQLVRPFAGLFGSENKNNIESIFEVQFSSAVNSGRTTETTFPVGHDLMSNIMTQGKSWGKTRPTPRAFDQFDEGDPRREASFVYSNYSNIFETNEKKKIILLYPTAKADGTK
ncbi:MAG: RagB/SusD family nutrient uptake outer membrane protein, partial [Bacteroidales bacterium]